MSYEIKRTDAEIDEQLNKAADGINDGSQYPGMSYETPGFCRLYVRENKRLAMRRKSRKFAPWLKDNRRDIQSIG